MNSLPQGVAMHARDDASQTVGAAERTIQPRLPEFCCPGHSQSVQAPESGPVHGENRFCDQGGGDPWKRAVIGHPIEDSGGELKDLFRIADQASENGFTPFFVLPVSIPVPKFPPRTFARSGNHGLPRERALPNVSEQRFGAVCLHRCARDKERNAAPPRHSGSSAFRIFGYAMTSYPEVTES